MADPVTFGAGAKLGSAIVDKGLSAMDPGEPTKKDDFDAAYQQLLLNHPEIKSLNDPRIKAVLKAAIGDAFIKGNEKLLSTVIPGLVDKINVSQIDLTKSDADQRISSEAEKAKTTYEILKSQREAQFKADQDSVRTNLDVNSAGTKAYAGAVSGFAAFSRFFVAVVDCFREGSIEPLRQFAQEVKNPTEYTVKTSGISGVGPAPTNAYTEQKPAMPGASSVADLGRAAESGNPTGVLTSTQNVAAKGSAPTQQEATPVPAKSGASSKKDVSFSENAHDVSQTETPAPQTHGKRQPRVIQFAGPELVPH